MMKTEIVLRRPFPSIWKEHIEKDEKEGKRGNERGLKETHSHCVIQLTPKTALEISSKEGREWGSDCKQAETS